MYIYISTWLVLHLRAGDAQFIDLGETKRKAYKCLTVALNTALNTALAEVRFRKTAVHASCVYIHIRIRMHMHI